MKSCTKKSLGQCIRKFKPVTHLIFDLDGTLLDTEKVYFDTYFEIGQEYGKEYTPRIMEKQLGCPSEIACAMIIKEMDLPLTLQELLDKYHEKAHAKLAQCKFLPGAVRLLTHMHKHGVPMAIATSSSEPGYSIKTTPHADIIGMFHHYVASGIHTDDVKQGKPAPDIFLVACKWFNDSVKPESCLVFEDAPNGVKAAVAAGMQCVWIPEKNVDKGMVKNATVILDSLEDFRPEWFGLPPFDD